MLAIVDQINRGNLVKPELGPLDCFNHAMRISRSERRPRTVTGERSSPLYLSASKEGLREVEKWVGHIGQQLDGIIQLGVVDVEIRKVLSSQK